MVNPIIRDESFKRLYHISPLLLSLLFSPFSLFTSPSFPSFEDFRIKTHLLYVHQLLANKDTSYLAHEKEIKRKKGLNDLEEYATNGLFPRNYDSWERVPSFVDRDGRLCAVAHIMSKTGIN
jgi:hypothetical protein